MSVATMKVPTIFTAVDKFSDVVSRMTGGVNKFSKTASSAVSRVDNKINGMWSSMNNMSQLAIGGGLGGLFYYAGKDVMEYEKKIASLAAVTGTAVGAMNKQIEGLGKETRRSVIDIAGSFEIVGSKMSQYLDNPEALKKITKASILMADASRMELEPAIESLTGVMNIFGKSAEDANYIVNKLSAGEIVGSISIAQTADILRQFGGTARLANVQVDESIALIQTLTKSLGVEGVGRGIRNLMIDFSMVGAFDKNKQKALESVGVNFKKLADKSLPLIERLKELKKLEGSGAAMGLFFKKTGIQTGSTIFQNWGDLERFLTAIKNTNAAQEQADKNNATLARGIKYLKDSFTNFIVTNNESNGALRVTKGLLSWMTDNMGSLITLVGLLVGAFILWKAIVVLTAARLFILNVAMGISAFQAGAMSIAMEGNAIAMGVYNIATLIATGSTAALGVSLMTVLWPVLLVVAALGLLTYAFWDSGAATDDMVSKQIDALSKGNSAVEKSTDVLGSELQKQIALRDKHNKKITTSVVTPPTPKGIEGNLYFQAAQKQAAEAAALAKKNEFMRSQKEAYLNYMDPQRQQRLIDQRDIMTSGAMGNVFPGGNKPNLAGQSSGITAETLKALGVNGEVTLTILGNGADNVSVQNSNPKGIIVNTTSTKKPSTFSNIW